MRSRRRSHATALIYCYSEGRILEKLAGVVPGWVEQSPPDFLFAVKASRYLTHVKRLTDMNEPGDDPRRPFQTGELTTNFTFLRFYHGGGDGNYSHRQLGVWARRIEEWRDQVDIYAYFNNDRGGFAVENGLWLKQRLGP
jgi:uncharacterized protein YecE (DUF72 family)